MLRRHAIGALAGALAYASDGGASVLVDVRTKQRISASGSTAALLPPGSTLKPFVLTALLRSGMLTVDESYPCPGKLRIAGRTMDCSHPPVVTPMRVDTALAYSCNCFVARAAERFRAGELARELQHLGFASGVQSAKDQRLQALGEQDVLVTIGELANAYRLLAANATPEILNGLEGAVEYGTAQYAHVDGWKVAGKTGSAISVTGAPIAWFAGFAPSRSPEVAIAVQMPGRSGGADAAPVAGRLLADYRRRRG